MRSPNLRGEMERRLLVNYRLDPDIARRHLPAPFRPQIHRGYAVAGICLIRLGSMRPSGLPRTVGLRSENAAHRFAVAWDDPAVGPQTGVYIPRRDSNSLVNVILGGRVFPGEHHRATFDVVETDEHLHVAYAAKDGSACVAVDADINSAFDGSALFDSVEDASIFFEQGSLGYSATRSEGIFDGLRLHTAAWKVEPVRVTAAASSFFDDRDLFPEGSAVLDNALLMRRVPVDWQATPHLRDASPDRGRPSCLRAV